LQVVVLLVEEHLLHLLLELWVAQAVVEVLMALHQELEQQVGLVIQVRLRLLLQLRPRRLQPLDMVAVVVVEVQVALPMAEQVPQGYQVVVVVVHSQQVQ
jgi:hypothetical protein